MISLAIAVHDVYMQLRCVYMFDVTVIKVASYIAM